MAVRGIPTGHEVPPGLRQVPSPSGGARHRPWPGARAGSGEADMGYVGRHRRPRPLLLRPGSLVAGGSAVVVLGAGVIATHVVGAAPTPISLDDGPSTDTVVAAAQHQAGADHAGTSTTAAPTSAAQVPG